MEPNSIEWHENNLKNMRLYLVRKKEELASMQRDVDRLESDIAFRREQIIAAERQGKESFDAEKFLIKRNSK